MRQLFEGRLRQQLLSALLHADFAPS